MLSRNVIRGLESKVEGPIGKTIQRPSAGPRDAADAAAKLHLCI